MLASIRARVEKHAPHTAGHRQRAQRSEKIHVDMQERKAPILADRRLRVDRLPTVSGRPARGRAKLPGNAPSGAYPKEQTMAKGQVKTNGNNKPKLSIKEKKQKKKDKAASK
jgi:hypothetical protein